MKGIDASELYCPEFTSPVLSLIKKHITVGTQGIVKTKEPRAKERLAHLCVSYGWKMIGYEQRDDDYYFIIER